MDANLNSGFMEPTHFLRDDSQSINVAGEKFSDKPSEIFLYKYDRLSYVYVVTL